MDASNRLNQFFVDFIDRNIPDFPFDFGELTFVEKRFELPPNMNQGQGPGHSRTSMFYDDPQYTFTRNFLMGIEYDLLILSILFYSTCDYAFDSTSASLLLTYLLNQLLNFIRRHW